MRVVPGGTPKGGGIWADEKEKGEEKMKRIPRKIKETIIIATVPPNAFMVLPFTSIGRNNSGFTNNVNELCE